MVGPSRTRRTTNTPKIRESSSPININFSFSDNETFGVKNQKNPRKNPAFGDLGEGSFFPSRLPTESVDSVLPKRKFKSKTKVTEKPLKSIFDLSF